jgi:hypothetical protein
MRATLRASPNNLDIAAPVARRSIERHVRLAIRASWAKRKPRFRRGGRRSTRRRRRCCCAPP